nr:hypothetical protein BaRGS_007807 [Batillaria attramentaria]
MMASVMPEELIDLVKSIPPQDEFLIYDIRGDLSSDDVVAAFSVLKKESSNHTKYASLSFPGASQVDVYPAEHISDFWEYYEAFGFVSLPAYLIDRSHTEGFIVFSGPYQTRIVTTPIVNIY